MTGALRGKAFFSLLARPAILFFGFTWLMATFLISEQARRSGSWLTVALVTPLPTALIASQLILEVQHATFAWTLPRLRQAMALPLAMMSLLWSLAIAVLAHTTRSSNPVTLTGAMGCAAFAALGFWCGVLVLDPLRRWRALLPLGSAVAVSLFAHIPGSDDRAIDPLASVAALAIAMWCAFDVFSREVLRQRPQRPTLTFTNSHLPGAVARYRLEKLAASRRRDPETWHPDGTSETPRTWVLAAFFERQVFNRRAALQLALHCAFGSLVMLSMTTGHFNVSMMARNTYQTLVAPQSAYHVTLAFIVTMVVCGPFGSLPFPRVGLYPQLHHPLSRSMRARVTWQTHWLMTAIMGLAAGLTLTALAWAAAAAVGSPVLARPFPAAIAPLTFTLSAVPHLLWATTRAEWRLRSTTSPALWTIVSALVAFAIIAGAVIVSMTSTGPLAALHPALQLASWAMWMGGALALHRWMVTRHFSRADLI